MAAIAQSYDVPCRFVLSMLLSVSLILQLKLIVFVSFFTKTTYLGRLKRCLDVTDPRTLFVGEVSQPHYFKAR